MGITFYHGNFNRYYLNISKAAKESDLSYLYSAWRDVYGCAFDDSLPWNCKNPKLRMPAICTRLKTRMISCGCKATDADRVLKHFKQWYKNSF